MKGVSGGQLRCWQSLALWPYSQSPCLHVEFQQLSNMTVHQGANCIHKLHCLLRKLLPTSWCLCPLAICSHINFGNGFNVEIYGHVEIHNRVPNFPTCCFGGQRLLLQQQCWSSSRTCTIPMFEQWGCPSLLQHRGFMWSRFHLSKECWFHITSSIDFLYNEELKCWSHFVPSHRHCNILDDSSCCGGTNVSDIGSDNLTFRHSSISSVRHWLRHIIHLYTAARLDNIHSERIRSNSSPNYFGWKLLYWRMYRQFLQ